MQVKDILELTGPVSLVSEEAKDFSPTIFPSK